jgi:antitoxin CptB
MPDLETEARRALWRSRRGLLELDLLLPPFARDRYRLLDVAERSAFRALLECEDTDIWSWLQGRTTPETPELLGIVDAILRFNSERC